jgi:hypothetical protein
VKRIAGAVAIMLLLAGCSTTKAISTSAGQFDKKSVPAVFSDKRCYQTAFFSDEAVTAAVLTTLIIGVPILMPTTENVCDVSMENILPIIIGMSLKRNCMVEASVLTPDMLLTGSLVRVTPRYRDGAVFGLKVYYMLSNPPDLTEIGETNMEYKRSGDGGFELLRENISMDEADRLENRYKDIQYNKK